MHQTTLKRFLFEELANKLQDLNYEQIFLLGDINGVADPKFDRTSKGKNNERGEIPRSFFNLVEQENLVDIWRKNNATAREYTFFSARQKSHSRIDMIWMLHNLTFLTKKVEIMPRIVSDHNLIFWEGKLRKISYIWHLRELLNSTKVLEQIKKETKDYFKLNMDKQCGMSTKPIKEAH